MFQVITARTNATKDRVRGPELYGFSDPTIKKLLEVSVCPDGMTAVLVLDDACALLP